MPDTPEAKLEEETRKAVVRLIELRSTGAPLSEEERLLDRVLEQHPELLPALADASDHLSTGDEESPYLHVALHRIVEQRVVAREMGRIDPSLSWHDAVHENMDVVAAELFGWGVEDDEGEEATA